MPRLDPYTPTPASRASRVVMMILPVVIGLFCVLLSFVPIGRIFGTSVMPAFALMAVYYWAVVRPDMLPVYAVFLIGLLTDLLSAGPIGLWCFVYVVTYAIVLTQRFMANNVPFSVFWFGFLLTALVAGTIGWCVASMLYGVVLSVKPILMHMLVTVVVFPIMAFLFGRIERRILPSG